MITLRTDDGMMRAENTNITLTQFAEVNIITGLIPGYLLTLCVHAHLGGDYRI